MIATEIIKSAVLGIIQGITEWLPISSTGHMILADEFIKLNFSTEFINMFLVVIQFGSILAVLFLYYQKLNPFSTQKSKEESKETISLWLKVLAASVPAAIVGFLFEEQIDGIFYNPQTVAAALIIYGILFIVLERRRKNPTISSLSQLDYKTAVMIGIFQVLALIPGTSRSGSTILGAVILGSSRYVAAEFSFFLAVPVMLGASALKIIKFGRAFTGAELAVLFTGLVVAFAVSIEAIKFLIGYVKRHDFKAFGYYRIVLGIIVLIYFFLYK